jgi:hypothetical protein
MAAPTILRSLAPSGILIIKHLDLRLEFSLKSQSNHINETLRLERSRLESQSNNNNNETLRLESQSNNNNNTFFAQVSKSKYKKIITLKKKMKSFVDESTQKILHQKLCRMWFRRHRSGFAA